MAYYYFKYVQGTDDDDFNERLLKTLDTVVKEAFPNTKITIEKTNIDKNNLWIRTFEPELTPENKTNFEKWLKYHKLQFSSKNNQYTITYPSVTSPTPSTTNPVPTDLQSALQQGSTTSGREALKGYLKGQVLQGNVNLQGLNEDIERFKQLIK